MSARSMFLRAACRLSTARKESTVTWNGSAGGQDGSGGRGLAASRVRRLTFGALALPARPQAEQGGALVQQRVGVFNTDPVDVVHTEVQLAGQL